LSDVYGATEALAKANNESSENRNSLFKVATGRARRKETPMSRVDKTISSSDTGYSYTVNVGLLDVHVRISVMYAVSSPVANDLKKLGITNPALLAWELLPYSFVVDWFLPIGNYISSLDATLGLEFKFGYMTTYTKYVSTTILSSNYGPKNGYKRTIETGYQYNESVNVNRVPLTGFPAAPLPSFKNPLSSSHVASAMALILQTSKR
jgi:hypothetical protein